MEYLSEFIWEKNAREVNEDALAINLVLRDGKSFLMAVVCDGIGSLKDGEMASSYVVSCMKNLFESVSREPKPRLGKIAHMISRQLYVCHEELQERGSGTTVCMTVIYGNQLLHLWSGDSRIYSGRRRLRQISKDTSDNRGRLIEAIGVGKFKGLHKTSKRVTASSILLCTDGFYRRNHTKFTTKDGFKKITSEKEARDYLEKLYQNAVLLGEKDNASAILIINRRR